MRLLVCGSRTFNDKRVVETVLAGHLLACASSGDRLEIIQGGAEGADKLAREWAGHSAVPCTTFNAQWRRYSNSAGPIRNQQMLDQGEPDRVVAFVDKVLVESLGTHDMVSRARRAHVENWVIQADHIPEEIPARQPVGV